MQSQHIDPVAPMHEQTLLRVLEGAVSGLGSPLTIADVSLPGHPLVYANDAFWRMARLPPNSMLGRNCEFLQCEDSDQRVVGALSEAIRHRRSIRATLRNQRGDGTRFWNALHLVPLAEAGGAVRYYAGLQQDVSEACLMVQDLVTSAGRDTAAAWTAFKSRVEQFWRDWAGSRRRFVLAALGGSAVDQGGIRDDQRMTVARLLLPYLGENGAVHMAPDGCMLLCVPIDGRQTAVGSVGHALDLLRGALDCHAGLAEPDLDGQSVDELVTCARKALALAMAEDCHEPRYLDPGRNLRDERRGAILQALPQALARGEFRLVYQPVVELETGRVLGAEALLRWTQPVLGEVSPGEFIDLLESSADICPVSCWVVDQALATLARWDRHAPGAHRMAINVSAELMLDDRFTQHVLRCIERLQLSAKQVELELTERSLSLADGPSVARLHELRARGVSIAIDDFGTGWSGLAYLARLPVDTIKVDLNFTRGVTHSRTDAAISRMTVELARGLGLRCVVEGIERPGQAAFFTQLRCREAQGYLYSRPLEAAAADALVHSGKPLLPGAPAALEPVAGGRPERHLLLLDDEENVLRSLRRVLRPTGWHVHITSRPEEAFELLATLPIGVVLADQRMPSMTGSEFLGRVNALYPATKRIVLSGYTDLHSVTEAINRGAIYKFVTKPWNDAELTALLDSAFAEFELGAENRRLQAELASANHSLALALQSQGLRLSRGETALDMLHAALEAVPVPLIGLDALGMVVMVNPAAEAALSPDAPLLGDTMTADLSDRLPFDPCAYPRPLQANGRRYQVHMRPLGGAGRDSGHVLTLLETA